MNILFKLCVLYNLVEGHLPRRVLVAGTGRGSMFKYPSETETNGFQLGGARSSGASNTGYRQQLRSLWVCSRWQRGSPVQGLICSVYIGVNQSLEGSLTPCNLS